MTRIVAAILALALIACASVAPTHPDAFAFGVMGDTQYNEREEEAFVAMMAKVDREDLAFVVHVGDLQADPRSDNDGSMPCTDETLARRKDLLNTFQHPVIVTPGDNDWSDCHHMKPSVDPLARLAAVRQVLFPNDRTLGRRSFSLARQGEQRSFSKFVENARWVHGDIVFITLHTVGFNNNLGSTPEGDAEFAERDAANIAWLNEGFEAATRGLHKGVMIFTQANPYFEDRWPPGYRRVMRMAPTPTEPSGFKSFLAALERHATAFKLPVAVVHGDTHFLRIDKPFLAERTYRLVENVTRVETFGSPYVHWVRVIVEPTTSGVFTFRPELVPDP